MKKWLFWLLVMMVCVSQSGCALFSLPGQIIGGMFDLAGQAINLASALPMPPPGIFF